MRGHEPSHGAGAPTFTAQEQEEIYGVPDLSKYAPDRPNVFSGFGDDPNGFFTVFREVFVSLADEEHTAYDAWCQRRDRASSSSSQEESDEMDETEMSPFPEELSFGYSGTPFVPDLRQFYNVWMHFTTRKSFSWCDQYRLKEAPDRRIRRLMIRENKRLRERGRKTYQENVRVHLIFPLCSNDLCFL